MPELLVILAVLGVAGGLVVWRRLRPRSLCRLTLREGDSLGLEFPITTRMATLGSEEGQTVVVSHPKVSRKHAVLTLENGDFVLRDCSRHGTSVNGAPVEEAVLRSGDLIRLGDAIDVIFTKGS